MLFSSKNKGYFVEVSDHAVLMARTTGWVSPMTIEDVRECPPNDPAALADTLKQLLPKKTGRHMHAAVGIYPSRRLVRRHTLELKRVKEQNYFNDLFSTQFRIEQEKFTIAILNATDGTDYDLVRAVNKDVIFAGLLNEDINRGQDSLLEMGIFPDRLEIGSVSTLGALVDYLNFTKSKTPTLVLEIGGDTTHSFIVSAAGVEASRPIPQGLDAMLPLVQKELALKDEESAKKLFYSNTFDFTGMAPLLTKKLLKELQSSIGFYEVQTGQSVGQVLTTQLSPKQGWLDAAIAASLGISSLKLDPAAWLHSRGVNVPETMSGMLRDSRWFGLLGLMAQYTPSTNGVVAEEKK